MAWPLSQDYNEAVQNPQTSFRDPELRQGQVVTNALGIPQPCSGNFADVYAIECAASKTKWAVKCFTREVRGLRERYSAISDYLQQVNLPFTVDFQYLEQGIRIAGRWYPILKMHWVEGFTLNAFVRDSLDKPAMLEGLSRIWLRMARRLREANLAHCDLQHGNVLLVPDTTANALAVKLIDYDGMWVPALAGTPSGEVGHPAYQYPQRLREGFYNREVDRFPLLVIATSLCCLRISGRALWESYDSGDNMLFREADLRAPGDSPLFAELRRINDPLARSLVEQLWQASQRPLEQSPLLQDLFSEEKASISTTTRSSPRVAVRTTGNSSAFGGIEATADEERLRRKAAHTKERSIVPWVVGGSLAACALLGGVLFWAMSSRRHPEQTPPRLEQQHVGAKSTEPTKGPKDNKLIGKLHGDTRPCGGCERGAPFDGTYDIKRQCRLCWLYHNDAKYRKLWGSGELSETKPEGTPELRLGLIAELFAGEAFERKINTRLDSKVQFDWGSRAPDAGVPAEHFSIRWQGWLVPPRSGKYRLTIHHDDWARLYLDGKSVVDGSKKRGPTTAEVVLLGQPHALRLDYGQATGPAYVHLLWSLDGGFKEETIPLNSLYHDLKQERLLVR